MRFGILGAVEASRADGTPLAVGGPRLRSLLAMLLLDAGQIVGAERLIDGLYGERPPAGAANALQAQVSRLRRGLRDDPRQADLIEFHPAGYRLSIDRDQVDAHRFRRLAGSGRKALDDGDPATAAMVLRAAAGLWRGPALADVLDAPFARPQAAHLDDLRLAAMEDRIEADLALGQHRALVPELQALAASHPLRECIHGQLMRALAGDGRQADALAVFDETRRRLADELGADPSPDLAAVHLSVLRGEVTAHEPATPHTAPAPPPAQLTSFVGRAEELDRIGTLLDGTRLVTLTGPGGAGKTRLAIEASARHTGEVCFVDLAAVHAGYDVPYAVLSALGVREAALLPGTPTSGVDPLGRLIVALTERNVLLILDNCEHVVDDAARLAQRLLAGCRAVRVLATSREVLGVTGETLCPIPQLPLPGPDTPAEEARDYPAIRLFADRAAAVFPGFEIDGATAATVRHICDALDGQPLAIELAAARLRSMTLDEIAARLDDRFRLLSRGDRTAAPRHQTLRGVVEWSWDLLTEQERALARRLTVFVGGATLADAERVCGLPDVPDLLAALVEKSFVDASGGRYRMLETIRAFCAEQLAAAGESERLWRAHAEHFLGLAESADPHLRSAEQVEWLARLAAEHGNLHAALRWAGQSDPRLALELISMMTSYWWLRGLRTEGAPLARQVLDRLGTDPPAGLEEEYAHCVANAVMSAPEAVGLEPHLATAKSIMDKMDGPLRQQFGIVIWGMINGPPADSSQVDVLEARIDATPWSSALRSFGWGMFRQYNGELDVAEADYSAALDGFRALGERWGLANSLDALAGLAGWRGDQDTFQSLMNDAIAVIGELGSAEDTADLLCRRGDGLLRSGDLDAARADYEQAMEYARGVGTPETLAGALRGLGEIARFRGDLSEAGELQRSALERCAAETTGGREVRSRVLTALGRIAESTGDAREARARHRQALSAVIGLHNGPAIAAVAEGMAGTALVESDGNRAAALLGLAAAIRGCGIGGDPDLEATTAGTVAILGRSAYESAYARARATRRRAALARVTAFAAEV